MKSSKSMDNLSKTVIQVKYDYSKSVIEGKRIVPPPPYPPSIRFVRDYKETRYSLSIARKIKLWNSVLRGKYWGKMKRFEDKDRPRGVCYDCNKPYKDFADKVIPDEDWEKINPTFHEGAGILCPTYIANRLNSIGEWYKYKLVKVG